MEELSHQASLYKSSPCFEEKEDGAKAKAIKTAKAMKADQEPMEKIQKYTQLSVEEIEKL